jgi:hypothetical protein
MKTSTNDQKTSRRRKRLGHADALVALKGRFLRCPQAFVLCVATLIAAPTAWADSVDLRACVHGVNPISKCPKCNAPMDYDCEAALKKLRNAGVSTSGLSCSEAIAKANEMLKKETEDLDRRLNQAIEQTRTGGGDRIPAPPDKQLRNPLRLPSPAPRRVPKPPPAEPSPDSPVDVQSLLNKVQTLNGGLPARPTFGRAQGVERPGPDLDTPIRIQNEKNEENAQQIINQLNGGFQPKRRLGDFGQFNDQPGSGLARPPKHPIRTQED